MLSCTCMPANSYYSLSHPREEGTITGQSCFDFNSASFHGWSTQKCLAKAQRPALSLCPDSTKSWMKKLKITSKPSQVAGPQANKGWLEEHDNPSSLFIFIGPNFFSFPFGVVRYNKLSKGCIIWLMVHGFNKCELSSNSYPGSFPSNSQCSQLWMMQSQSV